MTAAASGRSAMPPRNPVWRIEVRRLRHRPPDIAIGPRVACAFAGLQEPWIIHGGVSRHQVEQHVHAELVGAVEHPAQVFVGAVSFGGGVVVAHVVARVVERRIEAGVDPDRVAAKVLDVVELVDDALEIADAVAVRIVERLRIDFVENRIAEPGCHLSSRERTSLSRRTAT